MTRAREVCGTGALSVLLALTLGVTGAAAQGASTSPQAQPQDQEQGQQQAQQQQGQGSSGAAAGPEAAAEAGAEAGRAAATAPDLRRDGGRDGIEGGDPVGERAGDDVGHQQSADPGLGVAELRGSDAGGAGDERRADVGARHQHHEPGRDVDAVDLAARAARRPVALSRLLRVRGMGLPAREHGRDQADRGHPGAGVGRLGRQRPDGRGEHHHEVAARDAG